MRSSGAALNSWWRLGAAVWLAVVLVVAFHQWQFWRSDRVSLDILALLPTDEQSPELDIATRKLADGMTRQVIVMLGAPEWNSARHAATRFREAINAGDAHLHAQTSANAAALFASLDFYRPWRDRLLTSEQRSRLSNTPIETWVQQALASLYQPGAGTRLSDWSTDPLGLWPQWWAQRAAESPVRPRDDQLWLHKDGLHWSVLIYETPGSAFSLTGDAVYADALEGAWQAARQVAPDLRWVRAGVPLHAEAAAVQASQEINTIGLGSLAAVILLAWLAFRSLRSIALVGLSLVIACAVALSATAWVFGEVHLITLIFGASLVGVAEDYGIHYFAARQGQPALAPQRLMRMLLPALTVALVTSVFAYLALGIASFPGLRQMAFFSAVGLVAAMLTVLLWIPLLDRQAVTQSRFAMWLGGTLECWPRLSARPLACIAYICAAIFIAWGLIRLEARDDVRQLQSSPAQLLTDQQALGKLLNLPSPAQFYLIQAADANSVLRREEALKERLDGFKEKGLLSGYSAVSDWVPSLERQAHDAALTAGVEAAVVQRVNEALGERLERPAFQAPPLTVEQWLKQPSAALGSSLWLGETDGGYMSVVMVRGLSDVKALPTLAAAAEGLPGVRWVDKPTEISGLLERYRWSMTWLLLAGHILVFAVIAWRFGRHAWRAWLPTVLASLGAVALLGWMGEPWQLFNVLALALLLGVGVDYGIFLLEYDNDPSSWLAVVIGAGSTWLSFGLLGLSTVPALRAFGLTLMTGLALVLVLAPIFRAAPQSGSRHTSESAQGRLGSVQNLADAEK